MERVHEVHANGGGAHYSPSLYYADRAVRHMLDNVREIEPGRWSARCIMHEDRDNSLSVWLEGDRLCFKCHTGCSPRGITDALAERYPEHADLLGRKLGRHMEDNVEVKENAIDWYANYTGVAKEFLRSLPVTFTSNEIIFRFAGIDRYKIRIKGQKGAIWRGSGHTPDLWPLPGDRIGEDIVITEGESDCVVARALGFEAYAITKGAATGLSTAVLVALRRRGARRIVVVMDSDQAGRQAASKIVLAARQAGLAAIDLDLVAEGLVEPLWGQKDLRDSYKAGKGADIVEAIRHMLYRADEARPVAPRPLSEIMQEEARADFIIQGLLMEGGSAILAGEPKAGKSQLSLDMALAVARGEALCGLETKQGRVIYYAIEDGEDIVRDRVRARGLDVVDGIYVGCISPVVEDNVSMLEEHIDTIQPNLVIIDTLRATAVGTGKSENEASFADSLYRIAKLARDRGVAVIVVHHTVKATSGNPISDARGTSAITGSVDVVAGLYKTETGIKLVWRGRYGSGEIALSQYINGSFNYPSPVLHSENNNSEDYARRLEERLNGYYSSCLKYADKSGRVDVKKVVIAMWGMKEGKYPEGAWDKTYGALDELVRRRKLRKKERQYYVILQGTEDKDDVSGKDKDDVSGSGGAVTTAAAQDNTNRGIGIVQSSMEGRMEHGKETQTQTDMNTKRSLLKEARQHMLDTFKGGGELAKKTREQAWQVFSALCKSDVETAKRIALEAYAFLDRVENPDQNDFNLAHEALDVAFFLLAFAMAGEGERQVGWKVWDRRAEFKGYLYDYFRACIDAIVLMRGGLSMEEAIKEASKCGLDVSSIFDGYEAQ